MTRSFHQIPISNSTSQLLSIIRSYGTYRPRFLPEGVQPASGTKKMTEVIKFQPSDGTAKAMKLTEEMRSIADSFGLYEYICAENPTPLLEVVDMSVVTEANSAKMTLLDKKQVEQAKAMARVKMEFMKRISEEALDTAVIQEGIPLEATIDARDTYMIIRATYCVTSEADYRKNVREMREEWKAGKPITHHIKSHMTARMQVNAQKAAKGITADTDTTCIEES